MDNPTLNRFFSLHSPAAVRDRRRGDPAHLGAARAGNNNPTGVNVKSKADTVPFHPYYTVKDGFAIAVFLLLYAAFVF